MDTALSFPLRPDLPHDLHNRWGAMAPRAQCPDAQLLWMHIETGRPVVQPCRHNGCVQCVRTKVREVKRAIRFSQPSALLMFTSLQGEPTADTRTINKLNMYLRRAGVDIAWVWAAEPNPAGNGVHAHAWAWGDIPNLGCLQSRAHQVGLGRCDIKPVTHYRNLAYICKLATWNDRSLAAYQAINGSELVHGRAFWRDPSTGERLNRPEAATRQWTLDNPHLAEKYGR